MRATLLKALVAVAALLAIAGLLALGRMWWESRLPSTYNVMDFGSHDFGGGPVATGHEGHGAVSVAGFKGPQDGAPDARFTLTAKQGTIRLPSGRTIEGLTFNGKSPGPELRVRRGDVVVLDNLAADGFRTATATSVKPGF
jgi:FtsP/CotA-like multicopper oxidase with cupredoxin domain